MQILRGTEMPKAPSGLQRFLLSLVRIELFLMKFLHSKQALMENLRVQIRSCELKRMHSHCLINNSERRK